MRLIKPSVEKIVQGDLLNDIDKQIEIGGRVAYKSEERITDTSAEKFIERLIDYGHNSVLEHGTVYLYYSVLVKDYEKQGGYHLDKYFDDPYSYCQLVIDKERVHYYITTNYRVLKENGWIADLYYVVAKTNLHTPRITLRIVCDRSISHQLVRHRCFSITQESQRFCNYSKNRFGNNVQFIIPSIYPDIPEGDYVLKNSTCSMLTTTGEVSYDINSKEGLFLHSCALSERAYLDSINSGHTSQFARKMLINATKTELIITAFLHDWDNFLKLRLDKSADPDMQVIAQLIANVIY